MKRALSGSADGELKVWDLDLGECLQTLQPMTFAAPLPQRLRCFGVPVSTAIPSKHAGLSLDALLRATRGRSTCWHVCSHATCQAGDERALNLALELYKIKGLDSRRIVLDIEVLLPCSCTDLLALALSAVGLSGLHFDLACIAVIMIHDAVSDGSSSSGNNSSDGSSSSCSSSSSRSRSSRQQQQQQQQSQQS